MKTVLYFELDLEPSAEAADGASPAATLDIVHAARDAAATQLSRLAPIAGHVVKSVTVGAAFCPDRAVTDPEHAGDVLVPLLSGAVRLLPWLDGIAGVPVRMQPDTLTTKLVLAIRKAQPPLMSQIALTHSLADALRSTTEELALAMAIVTAADKAQSDQPPAPPPT